MIQSPFADPPTATQNAPSCTGGENRLNEKLNAAIELLLLGRSFTVVAREIGVDRSTLYRWRHQAAFRQELEERRRELWGEAADRLKSLVHPSLDVLERQLTDRYDRSQFRAAATVLRLAGLNKAIEGDCK